MIWVIRWTEELKWSCNGNECKPLSYGEIQTLMYLKISLSDYFSVFNSRTKAGTCSRPLFSST